MEENVLSTTTTNPQDPAAGVIAAAMGETDSGPKKPPVVYFDFVLHEKVQELHKKGLWVFLGEHWGDLEIRVRPFHVRAVVEKQQVAERFVRAQRGLNDGDEIAASDQIDINKAAVTMAITGARGVVAANDAQVAIAKKHGFTLEEVEGKNLVTFAGDEDPEQVREFFAVVIIASMAFFTAAIKASKELQKQKDTEIAALGEDFAFGRVGQFNWAD